MAVIQKLRKSFGKSFLQTPLPDLVEIQYNSYRDFLQADVAPENRKNIGLQNVFKSMFPIKDYAGIADLEFIEYTSDVEQLINFAAPIRIACSRKRFIPFTLVSNVSYT